MDNQHKQIKGYRDLSQEEIDLMNKIKALAEQVGELVDDITIYQLGLWVSCTPTLENKSNVDVLAEADKWVSNGRRDLQLGFMQLTRAVAKPTTF